MSNSKDESKITPLPPITHPEVDLDEAPGACGSGIPPADFNPEPDDGDGFRPEITDVAANAVSYNDPEDEQQRDGFPVQVTPGGTYEI